MFGLQNKNVIKILESLPNVSKCINYEPWHNRKNTGNNNTDGVSVSLKQPIVTSQKTTANNNNNEEISMSVDSDSALEIENKNKNNNNNNNNNNEKIKLKSIEMIGTVAIPNLTFNKTVRKKPTEMKVLPSDHYGLCAKFIFGENI